MDVDRRDLYIRVKPVAELSDRLLAHGGLDTFEKQAARDVRRNEKDRESDRDAENPPLFASQHVTNSTSPSDVVYVTLLRSVSRICFFRGTPQR